MFRIGWLRRQAATFALASALLLPSAAAEAQLIPLPSLVATDKGLLIGKSAQGMRQFLGIPYAAAPSGSRRWKPPAAESAYLLRDATRFAAHCPQAASPFGVASTTEDCLYLNVFTPPTLQTLGSAPMPVLVWLHPGGMQSGESDDYLPTAFVKRGFVVVTLNYRLGALGWMAHPDLTAESGKQGSGNYGLMDQQAALRWIQRNIASFGGDKGSVTIIGADAGGVSVFAHIASPASAGLFQRAIAQSGSYWNHGEPLTLSDAETAGTAYANAVGCQTLACLRAAPVSTLLAKQTPGRMTYRPNPDGNAVLPEGVYQALHLGHGNKVPVLSGIARDEYRLDVAFLETQGLPTNASTYQQRIQDLFGINAATALTYATVFYPPDQYEGSEALALGGLGTDWFYACAQYELTHWLARNAAGWMYEFNDRTAPQDLFGALSFPLGAYHGADIQYLMDSPDGPAQLSSDSQQLANTIQSYWAQFARTGNPNGGTLPAWPLYADPWGIGGPNIFMSLDAPTPHPISSGDYLTRHGCGINGPPYRD